MEPGKKLNQAAFVMIFIVIGVSTLLYGAVHQGVLAFTYLLITCTLLVWLASAIRSGEFRISTAPLQVLLYAVALYGLVQVVPFGTVSGPAGEIPATISLDPFATQVNSLHFIGLGLFFSVILVLIDSASRLRKVVAFITIFGTLFAFFSILQSVLSPTKIYGLLERPLPFGSFVSRNNFAGWMTMAISMPLGMLFFSTVPRDKRLIFVTASVLMGVSIVLSGSRGGLVALVLLIGFLVFSSYLIRDRSSGLLKVLFGGVILIAIVVGTAFVGGENTLTRISEGEAVAEGVVTRPQIWRTTIEMIIDSFPLGVGLGAYGVAYTKHDRASGFERVEQAHSDFLQAVSDAGLIGGLIGIAFLIMVFRTGLSAIKVNNAERRGYAAGAFAGIFAALFLSLFDFNLHTTAVALLFLTLLSILVAARSTFGDDSVDEKPKNRRARTS